jgi:hypothetical protein
LGVFLWVNLRTPTSKNQKNKKLFSARYVYCIPTLVALVYPL